METNIYMKLVPTPVIYGSLWNLLFFNIFNSFCQLQQEQAADLKLTGLNMAL